MLGVGPHEDIVRPDGARPGDKLVVGTGPGAEVTGLFATLFPTQIGLSPDRTATAQERLADTALVEDAMAATNAGNVMAMHDATEGGITGALIEMADGAGVRFDVDSDAMPLADGVGALVTRSISTPGTSAVAGRSWPPSTPQMPTMLSVRSATAGRRPPSSANYRR